MASRAEGISASESVKPMFQAQNWMFPNHSRSSVTHHNPYLFPAISLITMYRTFRARGLFSAKPAAVQPPTCVLQQALAFGAQCALMITTAVNAHHGFDSGPLPRQTFARLSHCGGGFGARACKNLGVSAHGRNLILLDCAAAARSMPPAKAL